MRGLRDGPAIEEVAASVAFVLGFFFLGGASSSEACVRSIEEPVRFRGLEVGFLGEGIWEKKEDIMGC